VRAVGVLALALALLIPPPVSAAEQTPRRAQRAEGERSPDADPEEIGLVRYAGFRVSRIKGLREHELDGHGCQYRIRRGDFDAMLAAPPVNPSLAYDAQDLRARVVFADGVHLIDRRGVVKSPDGYAQIEQRAFEGALKLVGNCR
jgi:hypothetical protein